MAFSCLSEQDIPPLLVLPTELKLQIIAYFSQDTPPNLACLRRTQTSSLNAIPKSGIRLKSSRFLQSQKITEPPYENVLHAPLQDLRRDGGCEYGPYLSLDRAFG